MENLSLQLDLKPSIAHFYHKKISFHKNMNLCKTQRQPLVIPVRLCKQKSPYILHKRVDLNFDYVMGTLNNAVNTANQNEVEIRGGHSKNI